MFRYRLQRPVLGALPTEWDPLRGLPWRGHRYCALGGGGSSFAKTPCGLRPPGRGSVPERRRPPTGGAGAGGARGGPPPVGRCGPGPRFGGGPLRPGGAAGGGRSLPEGRGRRSDPSGLLFPDPLEWPVFFIHALWRVPHHWFARGNSRPVSHRSGFGRVGGGLALPPGPHPTAAQGRRRVRRRAAG